MHHTESMVQVRDQLVELGHDAFLTELHHGFVGKTAEEKEQVKLNQAEGEVDVIREFWLLMQGADAVLVLNLEKNGVQNYVGANTLMEIGFAHVLEQKIFFYNPIPENPYCREELEAVNPVVIHGDLTKIV